jgi:hypothetical protein
MNMPTSVVVRREFRKVSCEGDLEIETARSYLGSHSRIVP